MSQPATAEGSVASSAPSSPQFRRQHVTTYVRHAPLFADDYTHTRAPLTLRSLRRIGLQPRHSVAHALLHLLGDWEGRDALLQLAQSVSLLTYSMAPIQRRRLHIASEGLANVRKFIVLGKWITGCGDMLQSRWRAYASKGQEDGEADEASSSSSESEWGQDDEQEQRVDMHEDALQSWQRTWEHRVGFVAEAMVMVGEGCELAALLGGSGILWRVIGGKLGARQRKGLDRIALVFMVIGFVLGLRHVSLVRRRRLSKLRRANVRLIYATDHLNGDADANTIFDDSHQLSTEQALLLNRRAYRNKLQVGWSADDEKQQLSDTRGNSSQSVDNLRRAENALFVQRKKMQLLLLERTSIRAELLFVVAELLWPHRDHTRLEGWTTLIAALCHTSRLTKEARWHHH